jgi:hypothetical protein
MRAFVAVFNAPERFFETPGRKIRLSPDPHQPSLHTLRALGFPFLKTTSQILVFLHTFLRTNKNLNFYGNCGTFTLWNKNSGK